MRMQDGAEGESTAISWTPKWSEDMRLGKLYVGVLNSEACRKPKYPSEQAARNMQWSRRWRSKECQTTSIKSLVMGSRLVEGEPWQHLVPCTTDWWQRQFASGLGTPCSMWRALTPDKYTLIEECWVVLARKEMKTQCPFIYWAGRPWRMYSQLSLKGHLYKTDTSVKRTPRVGPCLSLLPLFDSL